MTRLVEVFRGLNQVLTYITRIGVKIEVIVTVNYCMYQAEGNCGFIFKSNSVPTVTYT